MEEIENKELQDAVKILKKIMDYPHAFPMEENTVRCIKILINHATKGQKMTLTSAIEAAKEALENCASVMITAEGAIAAEKLHDKWHEDNKPHGWFHDLFYKRIRSHEALAALPEPKTEEAVRQIIRSILRKRETLPWTETANQIIRELKSHNVLFVKE